MGLYARLQAISPVSGLSEYLRKHAASWWSDVDKALQEGVFDVTAWGATGDGTTDDYTAIMDAYAALVAAGGSVLHFPGGTYGVGTMPVFALDGMTITGDGDLTVIKQLAGANLAAVVHIGATDGSETDVLNVTVKELLIDGNKANNSASTVGLKLWNPKVCKVHHIGAYNCDGQGFFSDTSEATVNTNAVRNFYHHIVTNSNDGHGFHMRGEKNTQPDVIRSWGNGGDGIVFEAFNYTTTPLIETTQCVATSLRSADNTGYGLALDGAERFAIAGLICNANGKAGVGFRNTNSTTAGRGLVNVQGAAWSLRNNGATDGVAGIATEDNAEVLGVTISGLRIQSATTIAVEQVGIDARGWGRCVIDDFEINGVPGTAIRLRAGTDAAGGATQTRIVTISDGHLFSNGGGAGGTTHDGISIEDSSTEIKLIGVSSQNGDTNSTEGGYELAVGASVTLLQLIGCSLNANESGYETDINIAALAQVVAPHGSVFRGSTTYKPSLAPAASANQTLTFPIEAAVLGNILIDASAGAMSVDSITAMSAGTVVVIYTSSGGNLTLNHNTGGGNLRLSGATGAGANWTGGSNSVIRLTCNGSNWYSEVAR